MNDNTQNQQPVADNEQQPVISEAHDEAADIEEVSVVRPPRHHRREPQEDKYFKIRNILNIIFMLGAVVGMAVFYFGTRTTGAIIIITAIAFKVIECFFRLIRQ